MGASYTKEKHGSELPGLNFSALDSCRNIGEDQVEHNVCHSQCQAEVEALTADIQDKGFATFEVVSQFAEVCRQTNRCE